MLTLDISIPKGIKVNDHMAPLIGRPGLYYIVHKPTEAVYVGYTSDAAAAFTVWRARLKQVWANPPLNIAFRCLYDNRNKRADWAFALVEDWSGRYDPAALEARADIHREHHRKRGRQYLLNVSASLSDKNYWRGQAHGSPMDIDARINAHRLHRYAKLAQREHFGPKETLVPAKERRHLPTRLPAPSGLSNKKRDLYDAQARPDLQSVEKFSIRDLLARNAPQDGEPEEP